MNSSVKVNKYLFLKHLTGVLYELQQHIFTAIIKNICAETSLPKAAATVKDISQEIKSSFFDFGCQEGCTILNNNHAHILLSFSKN